ncbi:MAG: LysM peptidoglycan-binding domain-containing protein [Sandaracinaceae bacterium]|nr:LysM peptidoglycan-binding domain-containing protein [Sandaracinaceae bacterium]
MRPFALWLTGLSVLFPAVAGAQYRVRRGDTLSSVAAAHDVSVRQLRRLNPRLRDPDRLLRGQRLRVRAARAPVRAVHRVRAGETLSLIAARRRTSVEALVRANRRRVRDPNHLAVGLPLVVPRGAATERGGAPRRACSEQLVFEDQVSGAFAEAVRRVAARLRMDPDHLMAVMHYETAGSFRASVRNPHSRAVGLIQFLPSTARSLGTSHLRLARLDPVAQLAWVERYLRPYRGRMRTIEDAYLAVFTPAGIGRPSAHVLYRRGQRSYRHNRGHDRDGDGRITVREVGTNARLRLERGVAERAARCSE